MADVVGDDYVIGGKDSTQSTLLEAIREYKKEAEDARRGRIRRNRANVDAYMGLQDFTHKQDGQSQEFLPKSSVAVEQFVGFAKRALTQFGTWYDVELGRSSRSPISGTSISAIMNCFLGRCLVGDQEFSSFPMQIGDGIKVAANESLCIFKIHGNMVSKRVFFAEAGEQTINQDGSIDQSEPSLLAEERENWKLRIDLVDPKGYFPDPSGQGLYEIHTVERDLHHVRKMAQQGIYDLSVVNRIETDFKLAEEYARQPQEVGQSENKPPSFRKKVVIDEFWGTLVDSNGKILHENCLCAMANDRYILRRPEPNPFWHGESPLVAFPLIRVPFSVWHKALMDNAVQLNFAMNELFNLIIDGGISSVWGIKQIRLDDLDDPSQVSGGIPQGETLAVKSTLPHGMKVIEKVAEGEVPTDAMAVIEMLSREFAASALSNELKLGSLPPKQVLATEIIEQSQSQAVTLDSIVGDVEYHISRALRLIWLTILQNMDDVTSDTIINGAGSKVAFQLAQMTPAERFALFANDECSFKVHGLSSMLARVRDFQKFMALLGAVMQNPLLFQAFFKKYSPDKILNHMMKMLSINPENIHRDDEEMGRLNEDLVEMTQFAQVLGATQGGGQGGNSNGGGAGLAAEDVGDPSTPAEINSISNPSSGLAGAGES